MVNSHRCAVCSFCACFLSPLTSNKLFLAPSSLCFAQLKPDCRVGVQLLLTTHSAPCTLHATRASCAPLICPSFKARARPPSVRGPSVFRNIVRRDSHHKRERARPPSKYVRVRPVQASRTMRGRNTTISLGREIVECGRTKEGGRISPAL